MEETKKKVGKLCEMKDRLMTDLQCEISKGLYSDDVSIMQLGQVVDMVKDLAEAEEKCMKACYYKTIIEEMEEYKESEPRYGDIYGYNPRRYSSGRYASKGHGHISGYMPDYRMTNDWDWPEGEHREEYQKGMPPMTGAPGYTPQRDAYGKAYHDYMNARRHYHESGSINDKKEMDTHAMEHLDSFAETTKEIMKSADQPLRKQMKADLKALVAEIPD